MKTWALIILGLLLLCFGWLMSCVALAYPEQAIRLGYQSCSTCHVAPTGGGALTGYGRSMSEEMASFSKEGNGQLLAGMVEQPERLAVGGDWRAIKIDAHAYQKEFLMQNDFELALRLSKEVWIDADWGRYGEDPVKPESRRNYVLWMPNDYVTARAGRFFPGYGLMVPDHTLATRQGLGFGEGRESYNAELGVHGEYGELLVTEAVADGSSLTLGKDPNYQQSVHQAAYLARAAGYVLPKLQVGASYRLEIDKDQPDAPRPQTYGPFIMWGATRALYVLAEGDRRYVSALEHHDVSFTEVGYELVRGLHVLATHEYEDGNRYGAAVQWFPFPHIELLARAKNQDGIWSGQYLIHLNW